VIPLREPSNHLKVVVAPLRVRILIRREGIVRHGPMSRHPQLPVRREIDGGWHHSDNGGGFAVDADGEANDVVAAAEAIRPKSVADHRNTRGRRPLVRRP
jgi:hypothetical protein